MTALTVNAEFGVMRVRFHRTLMVSIVLHGLLFGALAASYRLAPDMSAVVDVTWLEQPVHAPVPEKIPTVAEPVAAAVTPPVSVAEKLTRATEPSVRLRRRLQNLSPSRSVAAAAAGLSSVRQDLMGATVAGVGGARPAAKSLNRGNKSAKEAKPMVRGPRTENPSPALMRVSVASAEVASAAAVSRELGGATLTGLVADRKILAHAMPSYPGWATAQAVEASVTLYFVVLPNGQVKENVQVRRTAGHGDFDRQAVTALRQWQFAPLSGPGAREQWGTITFRFRLHD